jgi:putative ABC transport system permease protein
MIGIITYISVLERTKEIGILRAIGVSKKDVSRIFNAETLIVGLIAGLLGIGITVVLTIPINAILLAITGVAVTTRVPFIAGVILVIISVLLTIIGGLIPSKLASKKDPVIALRTE